MPTNDLVPGDLATIIKSTDGIQVGRTVQCVNIAGTHTHHGIVWLVSSREDLVSEYGAVGKRMHVPRDWLRKIIPPPLAPTPLEKTIKIKETI